MFERGTWAHKTCGCMCQWMRKWDDWAVLRASQVIFPLICRLFLRPGVCISCSFHPPSLCSVCATIFQPGAAAGWSISMDRTASDDRDCPSMTSLVLVLWFIGLDIIRNWLESNELVLLWNLKIPYLHYLCVFEYTQLVLGLFHRSQAFVLIFAFTLISVFAEGLLSGLVLH